MPFLPLPGYDPERQILSRGWCSANVPRKSSMKTDLILRRPLSLKSACADGPVLPQIPKIKATLSDPWAARHLGVVSARATCVDTLGLGLAS